MKFLVSLSLLLSFFSCTKGTPLPELSEFEQNRNLWNGANFSDYQITQSVSCYCMEGVTQPKVVVVRNGVIQSVNGNAPSESDDLVKTVAAFFIYIAEKYEQNPVGSSINYDSEYGYPTDIYFDMDEMIADEEIGFTLTDFQILN